MLPPQARRAQHASARRAKKGLTLVIKSIGLLTRKEGLSHEDFVKHWLEVHAPLAHAVPGVRRYVQSHIVEERTRPCENSNTASDYEIST
jgi:EthD domain